MARWTAVLGGSAYYAYSTNYLVDTDAGIIVDVEATPALRTPETWPTKTMIEQVKDRFGIEVKKLIGDTAYGTARRAWINLTRRLNILFVYLKPHISD